MKSVELLSPAGDFQTALAAFSAGADAVYCGLANFSARAFAKNFSSEDLSRIVSYARANGRKVYVTFNTIIDEDDCEDAVRQLAQLAEIGPDALIVQDIGIARLCRRNFPELKLHASTQLVAHNLEGVLALGELGFTRVVLARELSLDEITSISRRCGAIELECFIHGALCYSVSGLCLFGAMEKGRSGNRGKCPYCCRLAYESDGGGKTLAFSMKDLRLGEDVRKLADVGVASLKIEGRMKSDLYVASVTKYYRQILDGTRGVTQSDLETVFSRRTTELRFAGGKRDSANVIDTASLGHLGTPIGAVKRVTKDREGRRWLRFHTARALEKHDGLQFENPAGGKAPGFGIAEMRSAISRVPVFEVSAGTDVEVLLPEGDAYEDLESAIKTGAKVYCSMSNAVRRMFPAVSFRPSDYPGNRSIDVTLRIEASRIVASTRDAEASVEGTFASASHPEKTFEAAGKAFSKLGGTEYRLGKLVLEDPDRRFVPASFMNDLRRQLVGRLDDARHARMASRVERALEDCCAPSSASADVPARSLRLRIGQKLPSGNWDEVVAVIGLDTPVESLSDFTDAKSLRLALPVYTAEPDFNRLRVAVKRFLRAGHGRWEASDLATLRMLRALGVDDITADWTLYAFNASALRQLTELGVRRFVASPENNEQNRRYLAESGYPVALLDQQSTPLFISLNRPADQTELAVYEVGGLWITTRKTPRTFAPIEGAAVRTDLSWDPPC